MSRLPLQKVRESPLSFQKNPAPPPFKQSALDEIVRPKSFVDKVHDAVLPPSLARAAAKGAVSAAEGAAEVGGKGSVVETVASLKSISRITKDSVRTGSGGEEEPDVSDAAMDRLDETIESADPVSLKLKSDAVTGTARHVAEDILPAGRARKRLAKWDAKAMRFDAKAGKAAAKFDRLSAKYGKLVSRHGADVAKGASPRAIRARWIVRRQQRMKKKALKAAEMGQTLVGAGAGVLGNIMVARRVKAQATATVFGKRGLLALGAAGSFVLLLLLAMPACTSVVGVFSAGGDSAVGSGTLEENEAEIFNFLVDKGLNRAQAAAVMGNMCGESACNPTAVNPSSGAYGICQWLGGRLTQLEAFAEYRKKPKSDLKVQLEFFWREFAERRNGWSNQSDYDDFVGYDSRSDIPTMVRMFMERFERPSASEQAASYPGRLEDAYRIYDSAGSGGSGGGAVASVGDLKWPSDTAKWLTYSGHFGLDIQASYGTPIYAAADGEVIWAGPSWESTYGNLVRIYHEKLGLQTAYAHMSRVAVKNHAKVKRGQVIGYVGSTGNSSGPHIHFEIYETSSSQIYGYPIMDDLTKWSKYFDRSTLLSNQV